MLKTNANFDPRARAPLHQGWALPWGHVKSNLRALAGVRRAGFKAWRAFGKRKKKDIAAKSDCLLENASNGTHLLAHMAIQYARGRKKVQLTNFSGISIRVYGGSITSAANLPNVSDRYTSVLAAQLPGAQVYNHGIGGTGVSVHLACGVAPADVIVSEFVLNEDAPTNLHSWYKMIKDAATHVVVLDLWSWLSPWRPSEKTSTTIDAIPKLDHGFSVLDLRAMCGPLWYDQIPPFTAQNMFKGLAASDPEGNRSMQCYRSVRERTPQEREVIAKCRDDFTSEMQHGTEEYHTYVGKRLAAHIQVLGLTGILSRPCDHTEGVVTARRHEPQTVCIGSWGRAPVPPAVCSRYCNPSQAQADLIQFKVMCHQHCTTLASTIASKSGFEVGSLWGREDKLTIHSNTTSSFVLLKCPRSPSGGSGHDYSEARLGFVGHSEAVESGIFTANGVTVSTYKPTFRKGVFREQTYTEALKLPVSVQVTKLGPGAHIEITGMVCKQSAL